MTNDQSSSKSQFPIGHWVLVICWSFAFGHCGLAGADTLYIGSGGGIPYANVKVLRIADGQIVYTLASGSETRKPVDQVVRMQIDDNPVVIKAFTATSATVASTSIAQLGWEKALRSGSALRVHTGSRVQRFPLAGIDPALTLLSACAVKHRSA